MVPRAVPAGGVIVRHECHGGMPKRDERQQGKEVRVDNLAHSLAGLALGEAGLKRRTALGSATLLIGANLPDVDAFYYLFGSSVGALEFRRGWTHGVLALVVLPFVLTAIMLAWDRYVRRRSGTRAAAAKQPVDARWILVLAVVGVASHPLLDLLNTYGVRLLMPFSGRWFYGDALFIIDVWLWLALLAGIVVSRRLRSARPARAALLALAVYVGAMAASSQLGRRAVEAQAGGPRAARTMVGPVPLTPVRREVVRDLGDRYEIGALRWGLAPEYRAFEEVPVGRGLPGVSAAAATREGRAFLTWSRFPQFTSEPLGDSLRVRISDARYAGRGGRGWAVVDVIVAREVHTSAVRR